MDINKKLSITIGSSMLITAILGIFIIYPAIKEIWNISQQIYNQRVMLEKKYQKGQSIRKALLEFEKLKEEIPKLSSIFIRENKELEFITTLEEVATKNKTEQKINLKLIDKNIDRKGKNVPLELYLVNNFTNFMTYLLDVEKLNYYINFDSISITRSKIAGINDVLLKGNTYWQPVSK